VDIVAVRRDDALIDAIAADGAVETDSAQEYQLATLLANWRSEIVDEPLSAGPDLDDIVEAVSQEIGARQARVEAGKRRHLRLVRPLMGAAAAIALIAGGMTAFSYSAQPGDPLWKVKEVVFSEQAQATIANTANEQMLQAQDLIDQGQPEQAKPLLNSARTNATQLSDDGRRQALTNHWNQVWTSLHAVAPGLADSLLPTTTAPTTAPVASSRSGSQPASGSMAPSPAKPGQPTPSTAPPITLPGGITVPTMPTMPTMPTIPGNITLPGGVTIPGLPGAPPAKPQPPTSAPHASSTGHETGRPNPPALHPGPAVGPLLPTLPPAGPLGLLLPGGGR
jgi:hypothetical protein